MICHLPSGTRELAQHFLPMMVVKAQERRQNHTNTFHVSVCIILVNIWPKQGTYWTQSQRIKKESSYIGGALQSYMVKGVDVSSYYGRVGTIIQLDTFSLAEISLSEHMLQWCAIMCIQNPTSKPKKHYNKSICIYWQKYFSYLWVSEKNLRSTCHHNSDFLQIRSYSVLLSFKCVVYYGYNQPLIINLKMSSKKW